MKRTQEFVLRWSNDGKVYNEILRQRWNFSPYGAIEEIEDYQVDLTDVSILELSMIPDVNRGDARASLAELRVA